MKGHTGLREAPRNSVTNCLMNWCASVWRGVRGRGKHVDHAMKLIWWQLSAAAATGGGKGLNAALVAMDGRYNSAAKAPEGSEGSAGVCPRPSPAHLSLASCPSVPPSPTGPTSSSQRQVDLRQRPVAGAARGRSGSWPERLVAGAARGRIGSWPERSGSHLFKRSKRAGLAARRAFFFF